LPSQKSNPVLPAGVRLLAPAEFFACGLRHAIRFIVRSQPTPLLKDLVTATSASTVQTDCGRPATVCGSSAGRAAGCM
jgi:hypothetical protein